MKAPEHEEHQEHFLLSSWKLSADTYREVCRGSSLYARCSRPDVVNWTDLTPEEQRGLAAGRGRLRNLIYIGRRHPAAQLPTSRWASPYRAPGKWGPPRYARRTRIERIDAYENDLRCDLASGWVTPDDLRALGGLTFVCWCAPKLCHGHVLAMLVEDQLVEDCLKNSPAVTGDNPAADAA